MKRHIQIFMAGAIIIAPFAATAYVVWWAGAGLDGLARSCIQVIAPEAKNWLFPGSGALVLLVGIYVIGLMTRLWGFRWAMAGLERLLARVPLVKTVYESVRDILKLFSGDSQQMGRAVRYHVPGTNAHVLGIRTSTSPRGVEGTGKVSVFVPMSYQLGGFTLYVPSESVEPVDLSVEQVLKISATANAGGMGTQPQQEEKEQPKADGG